MLFSDFASCLLLANLKINKQKNQKQHLKMLLHRPYIICYSCWSESLFYSVFFLNFEDYRITEVRPRGRRHAQCLMLSFRCLSHLTQMPESSSRALTEYIGILSPTVAPLSFSQFCLLQ